MLFFCPENPKCGGIFEASGKCQRIDQNAWKLSGKMFSPVKLFMTVFTPVCSRLLKAGFKDFVGYEVTIRYDTRCYFNVRSKADISQLNLPHGTDN